MNRNANSLIRTAASFVGGIAIGALIPAVHFLIRGNLDPIDSDVPFYLQTVALLSTATIVCLLGCPTTTAVGVYGGLAILLFASGGSEYPAAALIALAVHGLLPALIGGWIARSFFNFQYAKIRGPQT